MHVSQISYPMVQTEAEDAIVAKNLDHLTATAIADISDPVDMTAEVVDNSIFANILDDGGDTSAYDRRYHSLYAIAQAILYLAKTACSDVSDPVDMTTEVVDNSILANILDDGGDTSAYDRRYNSLVAITSKIDTMDALIDQIVADQVNYMDVWSEVIEEVQLTGTATDTAIGNVTVAIPAGATIQAVYAMFMCRAIENTNAAANEIEATAQDIEVKESAAGSYTDAIDITQGAFKVAASTREAGTVMIGDIDIKAEVDGNDTYSFQWAAAESTQSNLNFNDAQVGLRIYFRC